MDASLFIASDNLHIFIEFECYNFFAVEGG